MSLLAGLALAVIALLVYGVVGRDDRGLDNAVRQGRRPLAPGLNERLPALTEHGTTSLAAHRGAIVVLNFWASWCSPCRHEAPVLEAAQQRLARARLGTVLGASYADAASDARAFIAANHLTFPSVKDPDTRLAQRFGTHSLPETFVLDRARRVVAIARGEVTARFLGHAIDVAQRA